MSDGNYNRNLLPYHQYASGLRAGRAQMHTRALKAFETWLGNQGMPQEEINEKIIEFRQLLD